MSYAVVNYRSSKLEWQRYFPSPKSSSRVREQWLQACKSQPNVEITPFVQRRYKASFGGFAVKDWRVPVFGKRNAGALGIPLVRMLADF
jgi:hypothetical protein